MGSDPKFQVSSPIYVDMRIEKIILLRMKFIADLHIHSKYSRATSKDNNILALYRYAIIKGIDLLGTGDFTHPAWIKEIEKQLALNAL